MHHFLPGYKSGGPLSSIVNMINNLSNDFDFKVLTMDRDMGEDLPYPNIEPEKWIEKENYCVLYVPSNSKTVRNLIKHINRTEGDIVYLNGLFDPIFTISILAARKLGILKKKKVIVAVRGEVFDVSLNFKKTKKMVFLKLAKLFGLYRDIFWHASTIEEKNAVIEKLDIDPDKVYVAINLPERIKTIDIDTEIIKFAPANGADLNIVFLSRISKDKNVPYTFDILKNIKSHVNFDIYGPIEDQYIWDICLEKMKDLPGNIKVNYKGSVDKKNVKDILAQYDVFFLPTFSENYGHAIVEALTVGTKVLISNMTPWRDLQNDKFGWDLSLNSPNDFINAINEELSVSPTDRLTNRKRIKSLFRERLTDPSVINSTKELFNL